MHPQKHRKGHKKLQTANTFNTESKMSNHAVMQLHNKNKAVV